MTVLLGHAGDDAASRSAPAVREGTHRNGIRSGTRPPTGGTGRWRRGRLIAVAAVLTAWLMLAHAWVPNTFGHLGSLLETFLPWLGASVPVLLALALVRRSATAAVAVLLPAIVWCSMFGGTVVDKRSDGGDVTVLTHNVSAENPDPEGSARELAASGAGLIALEELTAKAAPVYERVLAGSHPYHTVQDTVGLWSRYPLHDAAPVAVMRWNRALRATVAAPKGPIAVYAAHLASVRAHLGTGFTTSERDKSVGRLADAVRAEPLPRVLVVGDFNGATDDRALRPLTAQLRSAQEAAGDGFGFSWPAAFPVARIDQILTKGIAALSSWTLPRTGSDHLPVAASLRL
ncbi:endonuclease/exonuclease/phosphatase family protein [Streptomyces sp. NPDC020801]|uniref:endonuclease/exonuclease/phosphatase family protein n=1 Tax=Streptomyces sp. NPDC020801 TaxID=3365093 RepID=UPI0037A73C42